MEIPSSSAFPLGLLLELFRNTRTSPLPDKVCSATKDCNNNQDFEGSMRELSPLRFQPNVGCIVAIGDVDIVIAIYCLASCRCTNNIADTIAQ